MLGWSLTRAVFKPVSKLLILLILDFLDSDSGSSLGVLPTITQSISHRYKGTAMRNSTSKHLISNIEAIVVNWKHIVTCWLKAKEYTISLVLMSSLLLGARHLHTLSGVVWKMEAQWRPSYIYTYTQC